MHPIFESAVTRFNQGKRTRLLAFGSSNTEHFLPGMHWAGTLYCALRQKYGAVHTIINTGICGDTTKGLLARFEEDAAIYKPHLAFITIGGNDASPENSVSESQYEANLRELHQRFADMGTGVVFQTYYAPNPDLIEADRYNAFLRYMEIVRQIARDTNSALIDHLPRWERLRQDYFDMYIWLMLDGFHLNEHGNKVFGGDIARCLDADLECNAEYLKFWLAPIATQKIMDKLDAAAVSA